MFENVKNSIEFLLKGNVPHEFRTTLVKELHEVEDVVEIAKAIRGADVYYLQNFKTDVEVIGKRKFTPVDKETLEKMIEEAGKFVKVLRR